ncbi:MAG TPA: YfhO family protein [Bryobacteraceae bacterium]|jgi:hypothetical protein|nr:YfhO family protein [Bryobacteraceae bacterium]
MDSSAENKGAGFRWSELPARLACSARWEKLTVALISLLCTYAFFIEYLPPHNRVYLWSDIAGYHYPLQVFAFRTLRQGRFPTWDSSIYCGISFVGNVQAALFYPLTWLMYAGAWFGGILRFKALETFTLAHVWIAFMLSYCWLRGRCGRMASALGALVFSASGYLTYELLHPGVAGAMTWLPLGLWALDEADTRRDWRPLWKLAAASALAFLAGYPAAWLVDCVMWLVYALAGRAPFRAAGACAAIAGSLLLAAVQLLPAMEARSMMLLEPKYGSGAWGWHAALSYLLPDWFNFNPGHPTDFEPGCIYLYAGLPALFALIWAVRRLRWRPYVQPLAGLAAALILANPPAFLIRVVEHIPALEHTMQPFNFYAGAAAMVSLIAGRGLDDYLSFSAAPARKLPVWIAKAVVLFAFVWCFHQLVVWQDGGIFPVGAGSIAATAIALAIFSACLWSYRRAAGGWRTLLAVMLLLTAVVDYKVYSAGRWFNAIPGDNDDLQPAEHIAGVNPAVFATLEANRSYRIMCDESASPYPTDLRKWELASPQGFDPFLPDEYRAWIERSIRFRTNRVFFLDIHNEPMLRALGVRYIITHEGAGSDPYLAANPDFHMVGKDDSFYRIYDWQGARAPYYWADDREGSVRLVRWVAERRDLEVASRTGGRFVLVEQFFPGWKAMVDGREIPIARFDGTFQSVVVPPGVHRLTFRFLPSSLIEGAFLSGLALAGLIAVVLSDRRARARPFTAATA